MALRSWDIQDDSIFDDVSREFIIIMFLFNSSFKILVEKHNTHEVYI